jgi:hypothetical protein
MKMHMGVRGIAIVSLLAAAGCSVETDAPGTEQQEQLRDSLGRELSAVSAQIVMENHDAEIAMNLVARIEVQPNELVEFYEPSPGVIMVMGAGAPAAAPIGEQSADDAIDAAALWGTLTRDAAMPERLANAVARADAMQLTSRATNTRPRATVAEQGSFNKDPNAPKAHAVDGLGEAAHLTADWCDSSYYSTNVAGYGGVLGSCPTWDFNVCWNHVTGDGWASHGDANLQRANVCPYRGSVTFKVTADESWVAQGSWTVGQNSYRWNRNFDSGCDEFPFFNDCPSIRVDILNASGDGYQFRYQVDDI